jgi:uncharacterized protein (TIGR03000 family)
VRRLFDPPAGCCGGSGSGYGCSGSGYGYGCSGSGYGCSGSSYSCFGTASYSCFGGPPISVPSPIYNPYPATPGAAPPPTIPYAPPEVAPGTGGLNAGLRPASHNTAALVSNGSTARATVVVKLPVDARLFADGKALALAGAERKFVTPELPTGQEFVYRFRVEYERDGETVSVTKKLPVKAGATLTIEFTDLTAAKVSPEKNVEKNGERRGSDNAVAATPAGKSGGNAVVPSAPMPTEKSPVPAATSGSSATDRATIAVKLPPGATLLVDGRKSPSNEANRVFNTPPLPTGREFAYMLTAEVVRNGQKETFTQKVPFRAGERVEVDFTANK